MTQIKAKRPGANRATGRQAVYNKSITATVDSIPRSPSPDNLQRYKVAVWHPLLGAEVYVWYQGKVETRVCTWVSQNERWLRLDGELLPAGCLVTNQEYAEIQKAIKELGHG